MVRSNKAMQRDGRFAAAADRHIVGLTMDDAENEKPDYVGGMTVNERLFAAGLLDEFEGAAHARDRARMIALLARVEVADPDRSVNAILKNPGEYGY
jgi:hypothetical protein